MVASGFAGLGYQIAWTQQSTLWQGHEAAAVLAVVTAFFGGLAAGALLLGERIERSHRPVWWYAGCELVIAAWAIVLVVVMPAASDGLLALIGADPAPAWQWTVVAGGTFLLLLPATAAMGATLPAMARLVANLPQSGRSIAWLYAGNTLGAVLGVLAAAFWLVPALGLVRTAVLCAVLNLLCCVIALRAWPAIDVPAAPTPTTETARARRVLLQLGATGLLGIGYEVLVVRVLSEIAEDTVYTFAMLLAVYLVGTAIGAAGYQRWQGRREVRGATGPLLCGLAVACMAGTALLWAAGFLKLEIVRQLGAGMGPAIAAEALLAVFAFGLPTVFMGALFSHLCDAARASGVTLGRALGVNTAGAALAPLLFGVVVLPALGAKFALLLVAACYLLLVPPREWPQARVWVPAGLFAMIAVLAPPLRYVDVPPGGRILSYQEGVMASVSVIEDAGGVATLRINNRQQEGSNATLRVDARQAWLPLLLHPAPKRALFLGLGTGVTSASAAQDPALQVDAVELLPEVIEASGHFTRGFGDSAPLPHVIAADARRYVRASPQAYDVIVADNFHPARSGSGSLYTVEHFAAVRERLEGSGVFCQWLPLHQLDLVTLRSIVQSFIAVYPDGWAMLASNSLETPVLGLVGRRDGERFDAAALRQRVEALRLPGPLANLGIEDEFALLGSFVAGPAALRGFAGAAPANTDDHPVVTYLAPRVTYAPTDLPRDRLLALLAELRIQPQELVGQGADPAWSARLAAYWAARDRFIAAGQQVRPTTDLRQMLAQVREPLLAVLAISPDFRPAYDPLLLMATRLADQDAGEASRLLVQLQQRQPARSEAAVLLEQLGDEASGARD